MLRFQFCDVDLSGPCNGDRGGRDVIELDRSLVHVNNTIWRNAMDCSLLSNVHHPVHTNLHIGDCVLCYVSGASHAKALCAQNTAQPGFNSLHLRKNIVLVVFQESRFFLIQSMRSRGP